MPAASDTIAELSHVSLVYDDGTRALDDVSLAIRRGERLCVLGANGSGKSTLASVLCGLLAPDGGTVTLVGEKVYTDGEVDFAAYQRARRRLGLVFQNPEDQIVTSVVEDDVAFGPENLGLPPDEIERRVRRELHRVAMEHYAKADPARLSGGQRQRVTIASALAMEPELLVLDEPASALDVRGRTSIMKVMGKLDAAGVTIVHVTHFMDEALAADRVIVLDRGRITIEGTPPEIFSHVDEMRSLGLSEPFSGKLSARLEELGVSVAWTCDEKALCRELTDKLSGGTTAGALDTQRRHTDAPQAEKDASPAETVVHIRDVSYSYSAERALSSLTLDVSRGSHVALVGQTGSGKSTLLRLVAALETPDAGSVVVDGIDTRDKRGRRSLHGRVGYVMQRPERQLFAESVFADVAFGPTNMGLSSEEVKRRVRQALESVGLTGKDDASPFQLSGGQKRLCAIAGVLAMEPDILLLDEPTSGLDPRGRKTLRAILKRINEDGTTLIEVTHSMSDAARADRVVVIDGGTVALEGTPGEVFSKENERRLSEIGLGIPSALSFSRALEENGTPSLGEPLTTNELAASIARALKTDGEA